MPDLKPKRRWYQYSLRTLLLVVLLVSLGMSWLVVPIHRAWRQCAAIQALRELGWEVKCDPAPSGPAWLRKLFGDDLFASAVSVHSARTAVDDEMVHLRNLPELRGLLISSRQVTDAGLAHLKGRTKLQSLYLCTTQVSDDGLSHLKGLGALEGLYLSCTQVTDAGLPHLAGLTELGELHLHGTQVTNEGVEQLQRALPNCKIWH